MGIRKAIAAAMLAGWAFAAVAQAPTAQPPNMGRLAAYAQAQGIRTCLAGLQAAETTLLSGRDYAFRAFVDPRDANAAPFTAVLDTRMKGSLERVLVNIVATPSGAPPGRCTVIYEQTRHHVERCDAVLAQLAPKAPAASGPSFGAVTVDVERNLTVTVIPAGTAQCVSVVKEVAW